MRVDGGGGVAEGPRKASSDWRSERERSAFRSRNSFLFFLRLAQQSRSQMTRRHWHRPSSLHQHRATMVKGNTHLLIDFEHRHISMDKFHPTTILDTKSILRLP